MKVTKEQIINDMCLTYRHDYGIPKTQEELVEMAGTLFGGMSAGMTDEEREYIHRIMTQIFENVILHYMDYK